MMSKHTPGPWTFDECGGSFYVFGPEQAMVADNQSEDGWVPKETVARMRGVGRGASDEEMQANARLIAAAPEMFTALNRVEPVLVWLEAQGEVGVSVAAQIRPFVDAAIKKAESQ